LNAASDFKGTVVVIPYGSPELRVPPMAEPAARSKKLRVLFVGSLGQRKGLSYLFAACRQLAGAVE